MTDSSVRRRRCGITIAACFCAACLTLAGCGEDKKPAGSGIIQVQPTTPPQATQESTTSPGSSSPAKSDAATASRSRPDRSRGSRRNESPLLFDDGGPPAETLLASEFDPTADHEHWQVSAGDPRPNEADLFAVAIPERGVDSRHFEVTHRPTSSATVPTRNSDFKLPAGFTVVDEAGWSTDGYPFRIRCEKDGSTMVFVPAGTFMQGANAGPSDAAPEHAVELDAFYIDQAEVTHEQFERFRADVRDSKRIAAPARSTANAREPVTGIAWADAVAYAHWTGKELPTEAQWERAGRGPNGFAFPWGNGKALWHRPRQPGQLDAAMSFPGDLSPAGAFDLAGNAREWCADWYSDTAYKQLAATGAVPKNPTGPKNAPSARQRVVKGGTAAWELWARSGAGLGDRPLDVGFRCVWIPKSFPNVTAADAKSGSPTKNDSSTKSKSDGF